MPIVCQRIVNAKANLTEAQDDRTVRNPQVEAAAARTELHWHSNLAASLTARPPSAAERQAQRSERTALQPHIYTGRTYTVDYLPSWDEIEMLL